MIRITKLLSTIVIVIIILSLIGGCLIYPVLYYTSRRTVVITVADKWTEVKTEGSGEDSTVVTVRCISDTEGRVYSVDAELLLLNWGHVERWTKMEIGSTYTVTVYGWRIQILGWYPNIVAVK